MHFGLCSLRVHPCSCPSSPAFFVFCFVVFETVFSHCVASTGLYSLCSLGWPQLPSVLYFPFPFLFAVWIGWEFLKSLTSSCFFCLVVFFLACLFLVYWYKKQAKAAHGGHAYNFSAGRALPSFKFSAIQRKHLQWWFLAVLFFQSVSVKHVKALGNSSLPKLCPICRSVCVCSASCTFEY